MATNTYVVLDTKTLVSAVSSVTFSPIPQGYTDLILVASGTATAGNINANLRFNGDSSALYSDTYMSGTGSAAQSSRHSNQTFMYLQGYGWWDQSQGNDIVHIMNYSNTTTFKTVLSRANFSNNGVSATVGLYRSTNAITSIEFRADSSTFTAGSTFTIYGVANADNFAKATGGIVYDDANYWYHVFGANGTFTPKQALTCDYLVIAGGGGGGASDLATTNWGGGGGAGGYRTSVGTSGGGGSSESPLSLTTTNYAITVGAGGSGLASGFTNGVNSTFSTITSTGGGYGSGLNLVPNWYAAAVGGSGGGGSEGSNPGAAGTANQGYAGGTVTVNNACGGGGGAGGAGASPTSGTTGGAGGAGITSSISGTSVARAGGGGGAGTSPGTATAGGGAASSTTTGSDGTVNTGGGGGAGTRNGGNGGSGIVIIRYAK